jgi:dTDP-4-amino-4,6-dideoxygalactose transaminase
MDLKGISLNGTISSPDAQILLPQDFSGEGIWNQFTLRVLNGKRNALKAFLTERKIGCEIYYPLPLHRQECFKGVGRGSEQAPNAERLAEEVLSIPIFPELSEAQRSWVAESLAAFAAL